MTKHRPNAIYKFASDTTAVGDPRVASQSTGEGRNHLVEWCHNKNLSPTLNKTRQLISDFKNWTTHTNLLVG